MSEQEIIVRLHELAEEFAKTALQIRSWGDGNGGYATEIIMDALKQAGVVVDQSFRARQRKESIPHAVRKEVMERDQYRCVICGSHIDLTLDHIYPESLGGKATPDNLQTMCRSCNCKKGASV